MSLKTAILLAAVAAAYFVMENCYWLFAGLANSGFLWLERLMSVIDAIAWAFIANFFYVFFRLFNRKNED